MAVARAVAEMRVLGRNENLLSWFHLYIFKTSNWFITVLVAESCYFDGQLNTVYLLFALAVCL